MIIQENQKSRYFTTWHIHHTVRYLCEIKEQKDLLQLNHSAIYQDKSIRKQVIGRGANTLLKETFFDGLLIAIHIKGREKIKEDNTYDYWKIGAGEDWCDLVEFFTIEQQLSGMENLAHIPGLVGAAPIQNIAAYGQVFEDVCETVHVFDMQSNEQIEFKKKDCDFSYRNSIFKKRIQSGNQNWVITSVTFRLKKYEAQRITNYRSNYENLEEELSKQATPPYSLEQVYQGVIAIRRKKLPHVDDVGTNGSVFMNPLIYGSKLIELLAVFPELQFYSSRKMHYKEIKHRQIVNNATYKIAAGHIFEKIGWRKKDEIGNWAPKIENGVGVWKQHSLIIVNYKAKEPKYIYDYLNKMQHSFQQATGINIHPEINIV